MNLSLRKSLSLKLLIPISFLLVFIIVGILIVGYISSHNRLLTDIRKENKLRITQINSYVHDNSKQVQQLASTYAARQDIFDAYKIAYEGNIDDPYSPESQEARTFLRNDLKGELKNYESVFGEKLRLHFHLPPARSLVRLWRDKQEKVNGKWEDFSDDISSFRQTVSAVNLGKKKKTQGLEVGRGGFAIRGVLPVINGKKLYGSVEVLGSFDGIFKDVQYEENESLTVFMDKKFLNIATKLQDAKKYPQYLDKFVFVASSQKDFFINNWEKMSLRAKDFTDGIENILVKNLYISTFPMKDYSGKEIGYGIFVRDITKAQQSIWSTVTKMFIGTFVVVALFMVLLYYFLRRMVFSPLIEVGGIMGAFSRGELDIAHRKNMVQDEIGILFTQVQTTADKLKEILTGARTVSDAVFAASKEMNAEAQLVAQGASEQAAFAEEVTASIEEVTAAAKLNSENAKRAEQVAHEVSRKMQTGGEDVRINAEEIELIGEKVTAISDISVQSNILSLNAAVEAARAGDHGKGFAVVATEVQKLAEHSHKAAEEIIALAENSAEKSRITGKKVESIAPEMEKTAKLIQEISTASFEQSESTQQMNSAVQQLNDITQQNASASEELSAAVTELQSNAKNLDKLLSYFKV